VITGAVAMITNKRSAWDIQAGHSTGRRTKHRTDLRIDHRTDHRTDHINRKKHR